MTHLFHGSSKPHEIGTVLVARAKPTEFNKRRLCGGPHIERFVERLRPPNKHSRMRSIFLVEHPRFLNIAGAAEDYVYEVEAVDPQRHHWGWFSKILGIAGGRSSSLHRCKAVAERYADLYWRGVEPPKRIPGSTWEWLSPRVRLVRKVHW